MVISDVLRSLVGGASLTEAAAGEVFEALLTGLLDPAQIGSLLAILQARGVSVDELTGAARAMRRHVTPVPPLPLHEPHVILDTCGTGGAPKMFNISTAAAIVAAAAGRRPGRPRVLVAKHGNRSRTGRGSAEVLATLGVNVDAAPEVQSRCLAEAGVCFCFAIHHHPAMRHAAGPRKSLGFPTIFNLLGPLTNPAGARRQLLGVYDRVLATLVAATLERLGTDLAMVVHSADGLDEISISAPTLAHVATATGLETRLIEPLAMGIARCPAEALACTDVACGADRLRAIFAGERGPHADIVAINAGAALLVGGAADTIEEGLAMAREAIASGRARDTLAALVEASRRM